MLMPKRVKWRKQQRGVIRGNATRGNSVAFGEFGLQSLEPGWIPSRTIEAARVAASRAVPEGKVFIRIFPHHSVTATPAETRLGTGKGDIEYWTAVVKPGTVMFEIGGVSEEIARKAFNRVAHKLPVKVRMIGRKPL
ncbi:MAG: 50S ribosomal protein L16 [Planctomycetes bacterium]|nr:50S ribosomal protein L16 [Planctomycetota bacterium]